MNCDKFSNWLDNTEAGSLSSNIPDEIKSHVSTCKDCEKQLNNQKKVLEILKELGPTIEATNRIMKATMNKIDSNCAPKTLSIVDRILMLLSSHSWKLAVPLALVVIIYFVSAMVFPKHTLVSGNGTVMRMSKQINLQNKIFKILPSDILNLNNQIAMISLANKDYVEIQGTGIFAVSERNIQMKQGSASMHFSPSTTGYSVNLNNTSVKVIGTILKLETNNMSDSIFVEEGKIHWKSLRRKEQGFLTENNGINVTQKDITPITHVKTVAKTIKPQSSPRTNTQESRSELEPFLPTNSN